MFGHGADFSSKWWLALSRSLRQHGFLREYLQSHYTLVALTDSGHEWLDRAQQLPPKEHLALVIPGIAFCFTSQL